MTDMLNKIYLCVCVVLTVLGAIKGSQAHLQISLHVFSGRRDPVWRLYPGDSEYAQIVDTVQRHSSTPLASRLGYSGYTLETFNGEHMTGSKTVGMCSLTDFESFLLNTVENMVPEGQHEPFAENIISYVREAIMNC